jgi:hypothetical protein
MHTGTSQQQKRPQAGIVVKQTVKQEQTSRAKQKTHIRKRQKGTVGKARKLYNALKRKVKSALMKSKKEFYATENTKIKKLPSKNRKQARIKLRAFLKAKIAKLLGSAKASTTYKSIESLNRAIVQLKRIKW